jgi:hypothetical protein
MVDIKTGGDFSAKLFVGKRKGGSLIVSKGEVAEVVMNGKSAQSKESPIFKRGF